MGMSINFHSAGSDNFRVEVSVQHSAKWHPEYYPVIRIGGGEGVNYHDIFLYCSPAHLKELRENITLVLDELEEKQAIIKETVDET